MNALIFGILGLFAGWIVNYIGDVLPTQRKFGQPHCTHCDTPFSWGNYFLLGGCATCKKPRSWRTYIVLMAGILSGLLLGMFPPANMGPFLGLVLMTYFGIVVVIDFEHHLILHMVTLFGAALGLLSGILLHGLASTLIGGAVGLGVMLAFYGVGILFARYRARKLGADDGEEALGFGDVTLSTVLGLMLGWPFILYGLLFGVLAGGIFSFIIIMVLIAAKRYESMTVFTAYGPYLVLGAIWLLFFPKTLTILLGQ